MRTLALLAAAALYSGDAEFTTYIVDANDQRGTRVVADAAGNTYIAGSRIGIPGVGRSSSPVGVLVKP